MFDISPVGELCKVGLSSNWSFSSLRNRYLFFSQRELSKLTSPCLELLRWPPPAPRQVSSDVSEWINIHLLHSSVPLLTQGRTCGLSSGQGCRKVCSALPLIFINSWYGIAPPHLLIIMCLYFFLALHRLAALAFPKNSIVALLSLSTRFLFSLPVSSPSHTDCKIKNPFSWSRYHHCFLHHESVSCLWSLTEEHYRVFHCCKSDNKIKAHCHRLTLVAPILNGHYITGARPCEWG